MIAESPGNSGLVVLRMEITFIPVFRQSTESPARVIVSVNPRATKAARSSCGKQRMNWVDCSVSSSFAFANSIVTWISLTLKPPGTAKRVVFSEHHVNNLNCKCDCLAWADSWTSKPSRLPDPAAEISWTDDQVAVLPNAALNFPGKQIHGLASSRELAPDSVRSLAGDLWNGPFSDHANSRPVCWDWRLCLSAEMHGPKGLPPFSCLNVRIW